MTVTRKPRKARSCAVAEPVDPAPITLNDHNLNEFGQSVTMDFAPEGSVCEWCGKPAVEHLTVIGGKRHNEGGYFCHACGEIFIQTVADAKSGQDSASAPTQHPYSP